MTAETEAELEWCWPRLRHQGNHGVSNDVSDHGLGQSSRRRTKDYSYRYRSSVDNGVRTLFAYRIPDVLEATGGAVFKIPVSETLFSRSDVQRI